MFKITKERKYNYCTGTTDSRITISKKGTMWFLSKYNFIPWTELINSDTGEVRPLSLTNFIRWLLGREPDHYRHESEPAFAFLLGKVMSII